jgi:diguanylate cyclase (GGDEF)-like protein
LSVAVVVGTLCFVAWNQVAAADRRSQVVGDYVAVVLAVLGTWCAARAAARARSVGAATANAWICFAIALGCRAFGEIAWAWLEVFLHAAPFPSVADVGYVLFYPAVVAGFVALPLRPRTARERVRNALDLAIVMIGGSVTVWYFVLGPQVRDLDVVSAAVVLNIVYPLGDLLLVFALASASSRQRSVDAITAAVTAILVVGVGAFVLGDVVFGNASLNGTYDGTGWADGAWAVGLAAFVLAAEEQRTRMAHGAPPTYGRGALEHRDRVPLAPYVAILLSTALLVGVVARDASSPTVGVVAAAAAMMMLVTARQAAALRDNRRLLAAYMQIASTDLVTRLSSRRSFSEAAAEALRRCKDDGVPACVMMIDIDHFKAINDTFGHVAGDRALAHVAELLRTHTREADVLIGRYGGDEMAVVLFGTDAEGAQRAAARLIDAVGSAPFWAEPSSEPLFLSVSIGFASSTSGDHDLGHLMSRADRALYAAKRNGRNQAAPAPPEAAVPATADR